jgi:hypothetical protein
MINYPAVCRLQCNVGSWCLYLQRRIDEAVFQLHDTDAEMHNSGMEALLAALGNAALPGHLNVIVNHTAHPSARLGVLAVRALRRYHPVATARTLMSLLPQPSQFQDLFSGDSVIESSRCQFGFGLGGWGGGGRGM